MTKLPQSKAQSAQARSCRAAREEIQRGVVAKKRTRKMERHEDVLRQGLMMTGKVEEVRGVLRMYTTLVLR